MKESVKNLLYKMLVWIFLFLSCYGLFYFHPRSESTWYVFIGIALLLILFDRLEKFNLFGILSGTVKKAKKEIRDESEIIKVQLLLGSVISDSLGNERENIREFFTNGKIDSTKEIAQFSDYAFKELATRGFISYSKQVGHLANGIGESRERYIVTLKKHIH